MLVKLSENWLMIEHNVNKRHIQKQYIICFLIIRIYTIMMYLIRNQFVIGSVISLI
jgi:hypothetical protein